MSHIYNCKTCQEHGSNEGSVRSMGNLAQLEGMQRVAVISCTMVQLVTLLAEHGESMGVSHIPDEYMCSSEDQSVHQSYPVRGVPSPVSVAGISRYRVLFLGVLVENCTQ